MKKVALSIPTPCHENWNEMKPEDKGRFCGSCQKTVMDFTAMSDRQLAEFFKKPSGSVCGRFHNDQLDRVIEIPKKRIPWMKYFFTVTWPAFVLLLKGCGQHSDVSGQTTLKEKVDEKTDKIPLATVGMILSDITPVDSLPEKKQASVSTPNENIVPLNREPLRATTGDTTAMEIKIDSFIAEGKTPLASADITGYRNCDKNLMMGELVATRVGVVNEKTIPLTETPKQSVAAIAYPNPVKAGGQLTVSLSTDDATIKQVQLFSSSGAVVNLSQNDSRNGNQATLMLPPGLAAGPYFLRITAKNGQSSTVKIIVLN